VSVRRCLGRGAAILSVAVLATAGLAFAVGASAGAKTESVEKSFEEEGEHEWVVPAGVCSIWIEASGAQGGDVNNTESEPSIPGGLGGRAEARLGVTPGETLWVNVGGAGEDALDNARGEGGFNGGGDGGAAGIGDAADFEAAGGGGGGASDVRQGGDGLDERVLVAGGGGGGGGGSENPAPGGTLGAGGNGGGEEGDDGQPGEQSPDQQPGAGGTESEGGDGGIANPPTLNGDDGEFGEGGDGGGAAAEDTDGGGGGGGGWYGGGGGGAGFDGNVEPLFQDASGGGGGSGFGPDGVEFDTGEQEGDGEVTISYDPVADACAATPVVVEPKFTG
jgi:hypothetical protein